MTNQEQDNSNVGPQGTQVFEANDVNEMIAASIIEAQSPDASTPAIIGVSPKVSGTQYILNKEKLEIGRRPNSDIVLDDASVSSMHAQIIKQGEDWQVLNLLSSNGTYVNGEKVVECVLKRGDRVSFAGVEFIFTFVDEVATEKKQSNNLGLMLTLGVVAIAAAAALFHFVL